MIDFNQYIGKIVVVEALDHCSGGYYGGSLPMHSLPLSLTSIGLVVHVDDNFLYLTTLFINEGSDRVHIHSILKKVILRVKPWTSLGSRFEKKAKEIMGILHSF